MAPIIYAIAWLSGCSQPTPQATSAETAPIQLQLNWFPDAQHGGFYAALVHGDFAAENLDMKILPGGPNVPVVQAVASRRVPFAIANADQVLLGREQGADVVAVFAAMQDSPRCILVRADSDIRRLEDLRDITLALGNGKAFAKFLQAKLPLEHVRIVPYSGSIAAMLADEKYAQQGYVFSEPLIARRQGMETRCLMVSELGFNPYTSVLITHPELIAEQPDLVLRAVRAVRRGWEQYLASPEETNQRIHRDNPQMDLESLAFAADEIRSLCMPPDQPDNSLGEMTTERWATLARQLADLGLLSGGAPSAGAFTNRFVEAAAASKKEDGHAPH
ncbi:MAG: ABC transporter substrate-binding protein [Planctomycetales bacterium]|nr:ABC transporter substrate-binding protein [Planctomycetales bacterium]